MYKPLNSQNKKNKKSKNSSLNSNSNSNSNSNQNNSLNNNSDNNNHSSLNGNNILNNNKKINNNINNIIINNNSNNNNVQKKLTLPINSIPVSLRKKKELNKNINNNINNKNFIKQVGTKAILQHLPTYNSKSKEQNNKYIKKIQVKPNKENKNEYINRIKEKVELKKNSKIKNINNNNIINNKENKNEENNKTNQNQINDRENKDKDNNINDYEEDEKLQELEDDENLQINKVVSIDVKSNIMNNNYYPQNNLYYSNNSNNNSNNSFNKERYYTESDDSHSHNISNLYDPPSGRSNKSNNTFLTANSYQGNKTERNYPYSSIFQIATVLPGQINNNIYNRYFIPGKNTALKGSFLSTGTNSHSGQRFDTSNSNESGQSHGSYNVLQRQFSNNNLNNNYMMQLNPLFSLNRSYYNITKISKINNINNNNLFSSNNEQKEKKQIINLEDIARGIEKRTTVMIRNIPIKYTTKDLEQELYNYNFNGKFDCLYMPIDFENKGNKGYAFLNLVNPYHVLLFYEVFEGKCWSYHESKKICGLNFANFQGINEIKRHARNYKKPKQPTFYINTNSESTVIEVPKKYLYLILEKHPNLKYDENKMFNTIKIYSFN